jgi:molecular chaperone GrpE
VTDSGSGYGTGDAASHNGADDPSAANRPADELPVVDVRATIEGLREQIAELEDRWRRAAADLDNVRKRAARDTASQRADERSRVTAALLPIVDNLDLALEHAGADPETIVDGVRAVRDQATDVLASLGYSRHDDVGQRFDPMRHEAIGVVRDPDVTPGTIVRVVRPGYGDGDHQLRPASVLVAAGVDDGG